MVFNICQLIGHSSLVVFKDQSWSNIQSNTQTTNIQTLNQQIFKQQILNAGHCASIKKILIQGEEKDKNSCIPLLPLPCPFSIFPHPSPYFLPASPSMCLNSTLHHWHPKVLTLKLNLYNTYNFQVRILYLLRSLAARFLSPQGKPSPYNRKHCTVSRSCSNCKMS